MDAINAHNFVHEVNFSGLCDKDVQRPIDQFEGKKPVRQWANGAPAVHRSASHNKVCVEKIGEGVTAGGNGWIYAGLAPSGSYTFADLFDANFVVTCTAVYRW